jgi:GlpG protein
VFFSRLAVSVPVMRQLDGYDANSFVTDSMAAIPGPELGYGSCVALAALDFIAMRLIGHVVDEGKARTFGGFLYTHGIENQLEFQKADGWGIWVRDEDKLQQAEEMLATFLKNPHDPQYAAKAKGADELLAQKEKEKETWRKRMHDRRKLFRPLTAYGVGPLTILLIAASVVVFILSKFGENPHAVEGLSISIYEKRANLPEIRHGEIWRLFTPMFIHFTVLHILFNMLWLRDLGSMIEARQSTLQLAALVLVIAAGSNLAQYYVNGPSFGGMSGVVYGLFGYVWVRGRFDPGSGLFVHPTTVMMMLAWLVLCFLGVIPYVANTVHIVGLAIGAGWGFLSALRYR